MKLAFLKKTIDARGFSLAEALVAIIILLLVSSIVAAGIPAAVTAYDKAVTGANAQALLSTAVTTLRDELGTAMDVTIQPEGKGVQYYSADTKSKSEIYLSTDTGRPGEIMLKEYLPFDTQYLDSVTTDSTVRQLVTSSAATNHLYITYESIVQASGADVIRFNGLKVCQEGRADAVLSLGELDIKIITGLGA